MIYAIWPKDGDALRVLERDVAWACTATLPCSQALEMVDVLGLLPASQDVLEAEHVANHRRVGRFQLLVPAVHQVAGLCGNTVARVLTDMTEHCQHIDPDLLEAICARAAFDGAIAALSILAEERLIDVPMLWSPA